MGIKEAIQQIISMSKKDDSLLTDSNRFKGILLDLSSDCQKELNIVNGILDDNFLTLCFKNEERINVRVSRVKDKLENRGISEQWIDFIIDSFFSPLGWKSSNESEKIFLFDAQKKLSFNNLNSLGVLAYLIVSNKQIHSFQLACLQEYLSSLNIYLEDTVIPNILDSKSDAISSDVALESFRNESYDVQKDIYYQVMLLAHLDGAIDKDEEDFIDKLKTKISFNNNEISSINSKAKKDSEKARNNIIGKFQRPEQTVNAPVGFFQKALSFWKNYLGKIHSDKYIKSIESCSLVAKEDYGVVKPEYEYIIDSNEKAIRNLEHLRDNLPSNNDVSREVCGIISNFIKSWNDNVLKELKISQELAVQKERALSDFTISLVGRTKSGKSTLHAILTGEGKDKIGKGSQRTTRYNRVYQWNLMRIIDTPGIGAAEEQGRADETITEGILGESDVICLLVVDDSILDDILNFIDKIAKLNKPIAVLINHKENISHPVKFRRFIAKPTDWKTNSGESNLKGYEERIRRNAKEKGYDKLVHVYPVFLLAAQMALDDKYSENAEILWNGSNIDSFISKLETFVTKSGRLIRSQTLIDGTVQMFMQSCKSLSDLAVPVKQKFEELEIQKPSIMSKLEELKARGETNIRNYLQERYSYLKYQCAEDFAYQYYDCKAEYLSDRWESYLSSKGFEDTTNEEIKNIVSDYQKNVEGLFKDVFDDLQFSFKMNNTLSNIFTINSFDFKGLLRIISNFVFVIGLFLGPVGWAISIGAAVLSFITGLFMSKEEKRRKAANKISSQIRSQISDKESSQIDSCISQFRHKADDVYSTANNIFSTLIGGMKKVNSKTGELIDNYENHISWLNRVLGWRIWQYDSNKFDKYSRQNVEKNIKKVERSVGNSIDIYTSFNKSNVKTEVMPEIINFVKYN